MLVVAAQLNTNIVGSLVYGVPRNPNTKSPEIMEIIAKRYQENTILRPVLEWSVSFVQFDTASYTYRF